MSRRADHPVPPSISDLCWDQTADKYKIARQGITYLMDFHHYNSLKKYFRHYGERAHVADWYREQPIHEKRLIQRIGIPAEPDEFIPDVFPDY